MEYKELLNSVTKELTSAQKKFEAFHSMHEGYATLKEEFDELWDWVRTRQGKRNPVAIEKECIQIAAMALRIIIDCGKVDYQK